MKHYIGICKSTLLISLSFPIKGFRYKQRESKPRKSRFLYEKFHLTWRLPKTITYSKQRKVEICSKTKVLLTTLLLNCFTWNRWESIVVYGRFKLLNTILIYNQDKKNWWIPIKSQRSDNELNITIVFHLMIAIVELLNLFV